MVQGKPTVEDIKDFWSRQALKTWMSSGLKNKYVKDWVYISVAECLTCVREALGSIPIAASHQKREEFTSEPNRNLYICKEMRSN